MSKYDDACQEVSEMQKPITLVSNICGAVCVLLVFTVYLSILPRLDTITLLMMAFFAFLFGKGVIGSFLVLLIPSLKHRKNQIEQLHKKMRVIADACRKFHENMPTREANVRFKDAHMLESSTIVQFEKLLCCGMYKERKEIWVVAFCCQGYVRKVFASIGSRYRCRPAENLARYPYHANRLLCDEIRQYHNHPVIGNSTRPSPDDIRTTVSLSKIVLPKRCRMRTFIVYWNPIGEYRILEHDTQGVPIEIREFDIVQQENLRFSQDI